MNREPNSAAKPRARSKSRTKTISAPMSDGRDSILASSLQRAVAVRSEIETAAYFRAERRGFEPGHELEDWLSAEAEIAARSEHPPLTVHRTEREAGRTTA